MIETLELVDVVLMSLPRGRRNAWTIADLTRALGVSRREVEQALQAIADAGVQPLVAGQEGVWLAERPSEVDDYVDRLQSRIATQYLRVRALRRVARAMRTPSEQLTWLEVAS